MGKFEEKVELYAGELKKLGVTLDSELLTSVTKGCGPAIYNADAETVASSSQAELDTVKNNFLIGKMGLSDGAHLDNAIKKVIDIFGSSNPNKYRAAFYYLLVKELGLESKY